MPDNEKQRILNKHKSVATGLFVLMALLYITMIWLQTKSHEHWLGYVESFAEAAMVGALADWFAVTALFYRPLGLPIPHTNLIERSKEKIGNNLGEFIASNFLNNNTIRPYIQKLKLSAVIAAQLQKEKNINLLSQETFNIIRKIVAGTNDAVITKLLARKGRVMITELNVNKLLSGILLYLSEQGAQEKLTDFLLIKIKDYISANEDIIRERVRKESHVLIPGFVNDIIAKKIVSGVYKYIDEIQHDKAHKLRNEVDEKIRIFISELQHTDKWNSNIDKIKKDLVQSSQIEAYAHDLWINIKSSIISDLHTPNSSIYSYLKKSIANFAETFNSDEEMRNKTDAFIKYNAYKYIVRNAYKAGSLISDTVGNWEGKELSQKLELEVGKDLQYIRVNGTIVGGLVGLLIHTITQALI